MFKPRCRGRRIPFLFVPAVIRYKCVRFLYAPTTYCAQDPRCSVMMITPQIGRSLSNCFHQMIHLITDARLITSTKFTFASSCQLATQATIVRSVVAQLLLKILQTKTELCSIFSVQELKRYHFRHFLSTFDDFF